MYLLYSTLPLSLSLSFSLSLSHPFDSIDRIVGQIRTLTLPNYRQTHYRLGSQNCGALSRKTRRTCGITCALKERFGGICWRWIPRQSSCYQFNNCNWLTTISSLYDFFVNQWLTSMNLPNITYMYTLNVFYFPGHINHHDYCYIYTYTSPTIHKCT